MKFSLLREKPDVWVREECKTSLHLKQLQRLLDGPISPWWVWHVEPLQILCLLMTHIGMATPDQLHCTLVQLVKVVRCMGDLERLVTWADKSQAMLFQHHTHQCHNNGGNFYSTVSHQQGWVHHALEDQQNVYIKPQKQNIITLYTYTHHLRYTISLRHLLCHSNMSPAHLPSHSTMSPAHLPSHSTMSPAQLPSHFTMPPAHLPSHCTMSLAHLPSHFTMPPEHLNSHSTMSPALLPSHSTMPHAHLPSQSTMSPAHLSSHYTMSHTYTLT